MLYDKADEDLPNSNSRYNVVYIGMSGSNIATRLRGHAQSTSKKWSHFSIYVVWPNVTVEEIRELEGMFRHIYRRDGNANVFNRQKGYRETFGVKKTKTGAKRMNLSLTMHAWEKIE